MWVEIARSWAARGVPTLRIDPAGIGDSDGDERPYASNAAFYTPEVMAQAMAVLDSLEARGLPGRFILGGLCSGAYLAFRGALEDGRVIGAFTANLGTFSWTEEHAADRALHSARRVLRGDSAESWTLREIREGTPGVLRTSLRRRRARSRRASESFAALDRLRHRRTELLLQFCADEPQYEDMRRDGVLAEVGRWPNLRLEQIPSDDHTFRALPLQALVRRAFDDALDRALNRVAESSAAP
jgi:hypothetical protein